MKNKDKQEIIDKINYTIKRYKLTYKNFDNIDSKIFDRYYRGNKLYCLISRHMGKDDLYRLKKIRYNLFEELIKLRDNIIKSEKDYNLYLGESPHRSFQVVVNGGYGLALSRSFGDLGYLNHNGRFPMIVNEISIDSFNEEVKLDDFEKSIMQKSKTTSSKYNLDGYDISIKNIDSY